VSMNMEGGGGHGNMGAAGILATGGADVDSGSSHSNSMYGGADGHRQGNEGHEKAPPVTGIGSEISGGGVVAGDVLDVEMLGSTDWIPDLFLAPVKGLWLTRQAFRTGLALDEDGDSAGDDLPILLMNSRRDASKKGRHVVNDNAFIKAVRTELKGKVKTKLQYGKGALVMDSAPQIEEWGKASFIVAPHGGALAWIMSCKPGTKLLLIAHRDCVNNAMAAAESYFSYMGTALGLQVTTLTLPSSGASTFFSNYTFMDPLHGNGSHVVDAVVSWVKGHLSGSYAKEFHKSGGYPSVIEATSQYGREHPEVMPSDHDDMGYGQGSSSSPKKRRSKGSGSGSGGNGKKRRKARGANQAGGTGGAAGGGGASAGGAAARATAAEGGGVGDGEGGGKTYSFMSSGAKGAEGQGGKAAADREGHRVRDSPLSFASSATTQSPPVSFMSSNEL